MTGNAKLLTPDESLESMKAKNDLLQSRSLTALSGGKEATALLHHTIED